MIIAPEERSTRGPLFAFIDLLFLLVAFFTLLLFLVQQREQLTSTQIETVQQQLARVTGEEVDVPQALETLERVVEGFIATREAEQQREQEAAERVVRRATRSTVRLEYTIAPDGRVRHEGRSYDVEAFLRVVVAPLRGEHWLAFRAYAAPQTPFGTVVALRQTLLRDSNEFDTYWDNLARQAAPGGAGAAPAR
jgi:hypothetical protein